MLRSNRSIIKSLFQSCQSGLMLNSRLWVRSLRSQHMIDSGTSFWVRKRASQKQKVTQHAKRCWVALASTATRWKCVASHVTQHILWDSPSVEPQQPGVGVYKTTTRWLYQRCVCGKVTLMEARTLNLQEAAQAFDSALHHRMDEEAHGSGPPPQQSGCVGFPFPLTINGVSKLGHRQPSHRCWCEDVTADVWILHTWLSCRGRRGSGIAFLITVCHQRSVTRRQRSRRLSMFIDWQDWKGSSCWPSVAAHTLFTPCDPGAFPLFYSNIPQQPALMFYSSNEIAYEKVHRRVLLTAIHQPAGSEALAHATTSGLIISGALLFVFSQRGCRNVPWRWESQPRREAWWDDIKDQWKLFQGCWSWCRNSEEAHTLWQGTLNTHTAFFRDAWLRG